MAIDPISAVVAGVGFFSSIFGASKQKRAALEAKKQEEEATRMGSEAERQAFEEAMGFQAPFRQPGYEALPMLEEEALMMGETPEFQYGKERGERDWKRSMAARGFAESGYAGETLGDIYAGLYEQEYARKYGRMLNLAGMGADAAAGAAGAATTKGRSLADIYRGGGAISARETRESGERGASRTAALGQFAQRSLRDYQTYKLAEK